MGVRNDLLLTDGDGDSVTFSYGYGDPEVEVSTGSGPVVLLDQDDMRALYRWLRDHVSAVGTAAARREQENKRGLP